MKNETLTYAETLTSEYSEFLADNNLPRLSPDMLLNSGIELKEWQFQYLLEITARYWTVPTVKELQNRYDRFLIDENLPELSADELLEYDTVTPCQKTWLKNFIQAWESVHKL